jgi:16S rRNA (guanine966-N2)-methyltransferase
MRIGSGDKRGRRLHTPRGSRTRPTSARLKKSLFDVLAARLPGARVLDLYAGSGSLALEALSRGATSATAVERNRKAAEAIRRNAAELGFADRVEVFLAEVRSALSKLEHRGDAFDVVFADPPYRSDETEKVLALLGKGSVLAEGGILVLEHHHKRELRESYGALVRARLLKAGESVLTLFERR